MGMMSWAPGGTKLPEGEFAGCPSHPLGIRVVHIPAGDTFPEGVVVLLGRGRFS